jgi:predicted anti-sigma-YlaC factor YlaD
MTPRSSCGDIERLILDGEGRDLGPGKRALVEEHLGTCARCRGFAADRDLIRGEAGAAGWPALPDDLDRRTRRLLRENAAGPRPAAVPVWLLAVLAVVTIVTGIGLAAALADVTPETTLADLSPAGLAAVVIIIQNALTLLFAPVVLRAVRARRGRAACGA